jgi:chromosome partitioning protein
MVVIAIANQKGGVGKTTTAVTLGHGFARQGYRVLLADLDSQGNVADSLGLAPGDDLRRLLSPDLKEALGSVVTPSGRERLELVRSDKTTASLKQTLAGVTLREYVLADALEGADYGLVILDCAPSVDLFHYAALVAADWLLVPTRLDKLAVNGVRDVLQTLVSLQRVSHCQLAGVIPTFYERVTRESHEQLLHLARTFGRQVFPPIPQDTQCREATRYGQTLWEYAPRARALAGFEADGRGKMIGGYTQVMARIQELMV